MDRCALYDADQQNFPYIKRFCMEATNRKQNYLGENKNNRLILLTDECYPRLKLYSADMTVSANR